MQEGRWFFDLVPIASRTVSAMVLQYDTTVSFLDFCGFYEELLFR